VLITHGFDMLGRGDDEPLRRFVSPAMGFGGAAVWGFFLISGYVIARSWRDHPSAVDYGRNRFLRIWPGFAVAFLISIGLALLLRPGQSVDWRQVVVDLVTLHEPHILTLGPAHAANGSLWTIKWEVACYALTPFVVGRRWSVVGAWLVVGALVLHYGWRSPAMLFLIFLTGSAVRVCDLDTFLRFPPAPLPRFPDISYGIYLYGWPVQKMLVWLGGVTEPWPLILWSFPCVAVAGWASWCGIERHALRLKRRGGMRPTTTAELQAAA
jgi:peptidoglycan/LPS O-acetylase OafA/YrhL